MDLQQVVQRLLAVGEQGGTHAQLVENAADLLAGHARVIHHQHLLRAVGGIAIAGSSTASPRTWAMSASTLSTSITWISSPWKRVTAVR